MKSVSTTKHLNTVKHFKAVDAWTNDLQDSVLAFPVHSQFSNIWFRSILEDFA